MDRKEAERIKDLMRTCIKCLDLIMPGDDIVNIGNTIAYDLAQYEDYSDEATEILDSDDHPLAIADGALSEIMSLEDMDGYDNVNRVSNAAAAVHTAALNQYALEYALSVIEIMDERDYDAMLGVASSLVDVVQTLVGVDAIVESEFSHAISELLDLVDVVDIDMMGTDYDEPPESLDRGNPEEYDPNSDIHVDESQSVADQILLRLNLKDEDREDLLNKARERDDFGNPVYTTTYLVNEAQKIMEDYE